MKIISLLLRVLAILGAGVAIAGWVATNGKLQDAQVTIAKARAETNAAHQQATDSEQQFKAADSRAKSLESDLADAKSRATSARSQLAEAQRSISNMRSEVTETQSTVKSLEAQNTKLKEEIISMRTEVPAGSNPEQSKEMQATIASLNEQINKLKGDLAATQNVNSVTSSAPASVGQSTSRPLFSTTATIGTEAGNPPAPAPTLAASDATTATVLKADVKNGLVVISRGQNQGLQDQMELGIARGYEPIARIKVAKSAPDYSLVYILPGSEGAKFAVGDEVKLLQ